MKNGSVFTFGDRMWVALHVLSHSAAKKKHMLLKMQFILLNFCTEILVRSIFLKLLEIVY